MNGSRQEKSNTIGRGSPSPDPPKVQPKNPDVINNNDPYPTNKTVKDPKDGPEVNDFTTAP